MRGLQLSRDSRVNQSNGIRERKIFSISLYSSTGSLCLSFAIGVFLADWKSQLLRPFDGKCEPAAKTQLPESGVWSNRAPLWTRTRPVRRLIPRFSPRAPDGWVIDRQGDRWKWIFFFFFFFVCVVWCKWFLNTRLLHENLGYSGWTYSIRGKFEGARMHGRHSFQRYIKYPKHSNCNI